MGSHHTIDGQPCTLDHLCRQEPSWAASRIVVLTAEVEKLQEEQALDLRDVERFRTLARGYMDELHALQRLSNG